MNHFLRALAIVLPLSASAGPGPEDRTVEALPLGEATELCVRLHEEAFLCKNEFIDLVINLRGKYDPTFAEILATPQSKAAATREGLKEVVEDGSGELGPRRRKCEGYAAHGPPVPKTDSPRLHACFVKKTCIEKVACMKPILEKRFADRAKGLRQPSAPHSREKP